MRSVPRHRQQPASMPCSKLGETLTIYPGIAALFEKWIYVDNLAFSDDSVEKAAHWTRAFIQVCERAGFSLRQFIANRRDLISQIDRERIVRPTLLASDVPLPIVKVLGVWIDWATDEIVPRVALQPVRTMRELLREIANIHDPLGYLSAVTACSSPRLLAPSSHLGLAVTRVRRRALERVASS